MKKSDIHKIIKEVLKEMSVTGGGGGAAPVGGGATFTPGQGENYATPFAFSKKGQKKNTATKEAESQGYKEVKRPKHPSHTKLFDYLEEQN